MARRREVQSLPQDSQPSRRRRRQSDRLFGGSGQESATTKREGFQRYVYFISHAGPQAALAFMIEEMLREQGHGAILYEKDFPKDSDFVEEIADALVGTDYTISLLSQAFVSSNWCTKEFIVANEARKLIPTIVEDCDATNLPYTDNFIDLRDSAVAKLQTNLDSFRERLRPKSLNPEEVRQYVEKTIIINPLFEGGFRAERWQRHVQPFIETLHQDDNVQVIRLPSIVKTRQEAEKILKMHNADIVLYGKTDGNVLDLGFVSSRGWNFQSKGGFQLPRDLKFKVRSENFSDLGCVLKLAYGNLEAARNRYEKAMVHFSEALGYGINPDRARNAGVQYIYLSLALIQIRMEHWEKALESATMAIHLDPECAMAYANRGTIFEMGYKKFQLALEDYNAAIKIDPLIAMTYENRGNLLAVVFKEYKNGLADLNKSIQLNPFSATAFTKRGYLYNTNERKDDKALKDYNKALELDPTSVTAFNNRGHLYETSFLDFDRALADYTAALRYEASSLRYTKRGALYNRIKKYELALDDLNMAVRLGPTPGAYGHRGFTQLELKNLHAAKSDLDIEILLNPKDVFSRWNRGIVFREMGESELALADFSETIEILKSSTHIDKTYLSEVFTTRASLYRDLSQWELALLDYTSAINLYPQGERAFYSRGYLYLQIDQNEKALSDLSKAIKLNPLNHRTHASLSYVYTKMGEYSRSIDAATKALTIDPNFGEAYINRGVAHFRLGKNIEAVDDLSIALKLKPDHLRIYWYRGQSYMALSKWCEAFQDFKQYYELGGKDSQLNTLLSDMQRRCVDED